MKILSVIAAWRRRYVFNAAIRAYMRNEGVSKEVATKALNDYLRDAQLIADIRAYGEAVAANARKEPR